MRLFVAFNLPAEERQNIHRACSVLRDRELPVRWVRPDRYHVTLKFLGDVPGEALPEVTDAVERAARDNGPFSMELSGFGAFPTIRRPRVLWLGVEASPRIRCLKQDLEWSLVDRGFDRETGAFHPHVTLGRAKDGSGAGAFRGVDEVVAAMEYAASVPCETVDVMRSTLSREGPEYSVVSSIELGAAG